MPNAQGALQHVRGLLAGRTPQEISRTTRTRCARITRATLAIWRTRISLSQWRTHTRPAKVRGCSPVLLRSTRQALRRAGTRETHGLCWPLSLPLTGPSFWNSARVLYNPWFAYSTARRIAPAPAQSRAIAGAHCRAPSADSAQAGTPWCHKNVIFGVMCHPTNPLSLVSDPECP